ncbi:hypothetical protein [Mycoplasma suis]|uniref:Uncharacterized protein n=1 Tax=Mycoplasma suis (strain Illinois) TaxID=768700 RepID=F0QS68_MYCSL|nr:hypothetical protein [Mycoplasma suis]ADX98338.1 hypothetical protein MSU_0817 [Mycoplasma suis str. Illinois]
MNTVNNQVKYISFFIKCIPSEGHIFKCEIDGKEENYLLLVSDFEEGEKGKKIERLIVHFEKFDGENYRKSDLYDYCDHPLFAEDDEIITKFEDLKIQKLDEENKLILVFDLYQEHLNKSLFFSNEDSKMLFNKFIEKWQKERNLGKTADKIDKLYPDHF